MTNHIYISTRLDRRHQAPRPSDAGGDGLSVLDRVIRSSKQVQVLFLSILIIVSAQFIILPPLASAGAWLTIDSSHYEEHCGDSNGRNLTEALDGTDGWIHNVNHTHYFVLDLGVSYNVTKLRSRSNNFRDPTDVDVYVSPTNGSWGTAVASNITTWQDTTSWVEVDSTDKVGRYVRVEIQNTENGSNYVGYGAASPFSIFDVYVETPTFDQDSFRGRNDNGNETTATWKAAADTNWTQKVDRNFRVRFVIQETDGSSADDKTFQLEYNLNSTGWNDVNGSSSVVRSSDSTYLTDGADTTQQIGSGTPVGSNNDAFDEVNGLAGSTNLDFSGSDEVEVEYSVQIRSADVANDDTIQLRVKGLESYTGTPTITVSGIPEFDQDAFRGRNDDGSESAATWKAIANSNWNQKMDENFRVRFVVQETGDGDVDDKTFQLEYNHNGGGWNDVNGSSSAVRAWASPNVTDRADTTQQIGSGTFVDPNAGFDEADGQVGGASLDFSGSDEVEVEYCVQIRSAVVSATDTIQLRVKGLDSYTDTPTVTATSSTPPAYDQDAFRGRNDNGNETTATWKVAANTNWTQKVDQNFRVRFVIQETAGSADTDKAFQLEYNHNSGGWNDVTGASSVVRAWASPNVADGADTTQQIGSGTFVDPNAGFDEVNGQAGSTALDFSGSDEAEVEYCLQIRSVDVANDDTIQMRVKSLNTYANTPTITVSGILEYDQDRFRARNDNGNESTATWKAAANTNWSQDVNDNFRVRFVVQEIGDASDNNKTFQLEYRRNAGSWADVTGTSSVVQATASSNVADGADTTQQIGSGIFVDPNAGFDEVNGQVGGAALDFSGSDEVELEFCLQIVSGDVTNDDTIQLRIKGLGNYTNTPTITVQGVACSFVYRKSITIDASKVGGSADLTDFPILISLTDTDLKDIDNGGHVKDSGGADIIFRSLSSSACSPDSSPCTLDHEIEKYVASTGRLIAWVRIPVLDYNDNSVIYMFYGNACSDSGDLPNPEDVWNTDFKLVQHLNETTGTHSDSTSNDNDSTAVTVTQQGADIGKIDGADEFNGSGDSITLTNEITFDDDYTVEFWIASDDLTQRTVLGKIDTNNYIGLINSTTLRIRTNGGTNLDWAVPSMSTATYYHVAFTKDTSDNWRCYLNGSESTDGAWSNTSTFQIKTIGNAYTGTTYAYYGKLDEIRVSSTARTGGWIETSFNNQDDPGNIGSPGFYTVGSEVSEPATAVSLISFTATGQNNAVSVEWQTAREWDNLGFHLYRATSPQGPYERLTDKLISATVKPGKGGSYSFVDTDVTIGSLYYYKLEDIDIYGKYTEHGPICVDWDADGMPDDWEITHGLNPWVNEADLDYDGDGLSNLEEYEYDLNPFSTDSDGDGIADSGEDGRLPHREDRAARSIGRGVEVLDHDDSGMSITLNTSGFEAEVVTVGAKEYEQLTIADYVHGYTTEVGAPQLPLKGLLIDVPAGKAARLSVVDSRVQSYSGYQVYPVPEAVVDATGGMAAVGNVFVQDDLAYGKDGFYPQAIAALGDRCIFRDQIKQQLIFYPIGFNPASGQLNVYQRIELRIDFVEAPDDPLMAAVPAPWQVPDAQPGVLSSLAMGFAVAPTLVNPIRPLLSSVGAAVAALWSPPDEAAGDVFKIMTDTEGIYQITKDFLDAYGVDTSAIRLSQVRLYYLGQEVAIEVFDQNNDDLMDADDTIHFYAEPINPAFAKYSRENVYWLTLSGGAGSPVRMDSIEGNPSGGQVAADFAHSSHHEQQMLYWLKVPGADSLKRWFYLPFVQGDAHSGGGQPVSFTLTVPHPTSSGNLIVSMVGQTNTYHQVRVAINGVEQDFSWSGIGYYEAIIENVPLVDGDNTVRLQCLSFDGNDSILVDWFKVNYWRDYVAVDNRLTFSPDSGDRFVIDGFSNSSLLAYDISNPAAVARIENAVIADSDPYSVEFRAQVTGDTYLVIAADAVNIPVDLVQDTAANLAAAANGADYILVTHRDVGWDINGHQHSWLTDLVSHREAQGLRVFVADIEDIYDAFSFGLKSPQALKDFLAYVYSNWTPPAPAYVLLVGDSTYDPNDYWNMADPTAYLPTYLTYTDYKGETVSDQWFVTFSGEDAVADMHIGRLPAADAAQAAVMVGKIIAYETAANTQTWTNNMLLVADNQRPGADYLYEADFETINEEVAALVPDTMADPFKGYLNDYAAPAYLTEDIINTINNGVLVVNYAGHGATQILAEEHIFEAADVTALTNTDKLTFFVSMSCEAGFFAYPENWFFPSLAEALLRSEAGTVAALMPTGMTTTDGQQVLDTALFESIFKKDIRTLGPAIADAKQTLLANGDDTYEQVADTFMLFGDPATALKIPLPHIPTGISAERQDDGVYIHWDEAFDCNNNPVVGYNIYRAASEVGPFSRINPALISYTVFVDADSEVGMTAGSGGSSVNSYYAVSAVDENGFESELSIAVKPAAAEPPPPTEPPPETKPTPEMGPSSTGGSSASGSGGCFIGIADSKVPVNLWWIALFLIVVLTVAKAAGIRKP